MRLLLDTHVLLWWLEDNPRLGRAARNLIANVDNEALVSQVSLWEIAIKQRVGKLRIGPSAVLSRMPELGLKVLSVSNDHILALSDLGYHHGDPFDHLLLAQALVERAAVITSDAKFPLYGVPCIAA